MDLTGCSRSEARPAGGGAFSLNRHQQKTIIESSAEHLSGLKTSIAHPGRKSTQNRGLHAAEYGPGYIVAYMIADNSNKPSLPQISIELRLVRIKTLGITARQAVYAAVLGRSSTSYAQFIENGSGRIRIPKGRTWKSGGFGPTQELDASDIDMQLAAIYSHHRLRLCIHYHR